MSVLLLLKKMLSLVAYPLLTSLLTAAWAGVLLWRGRRLAGGLLLIAALGWLWLWSMPVFGEWVRASLEQRYPALPLEQIPNADAIVVLGGAVEAAVPPDRPHPNLYLGADRIWYAARLYHAGKAPLILVSGGNLPWSGVERPEAEVIAEFLIQLAVPETAIVRETASRTTQENRDYSTPILRDRNIRRILLVTSALHMPRALALFQNTGLELEITPAPTDFEVFSQSAANPLRWLPDALALADSSRAFKEYLGRFVDRLTEWVAGVFA